MGNKTASSAHRNRQSTKNVTELMDMNSFIEQCAEEQYLHKTYCCGMEFVKKQTRKIIWENNFIDHCSEVNDEFGWARELIDLVAYNRQSKAVYSRQINSLKEAIKKQAETEREILISPSEVEQFKNNLKRSVLLSASQTSKYFQEHSSRIASNISITSRPTKKIEFTRFNNSARRVSISSKKLESSPSISSGKSGRSGRSGLRKSIISFVDDTISSVFGNERQISKEVSKKLQIFLKFSMILEKHFSDPKCMLAQIKRKFIEYLVKNYSDVSGTAQKISEFIDSINQFMSILKEAVIDYYNLNSFCEGEPHQNGFIANQENILNICNSIFFKDNVFYDVLFKALVKYNQNRQFQFQKIAEKLTDIQPEQFYVKDKFCLNMKTIEACGKSNENSSQENKQQMDPYSQCKLILNELQKSKTPINKMKIILSCSQMINKQIEKFYDSQGLDREKWMLDADQILSIFCYIIVSSKIPHLLTHLFILDNFSTTNQMISIFGYYLSVMNCAVQQLEGDYLNPSDLSHADI